MPRGENRPGRFTQLDFDSLATVAEDTPAAAQLPDVQPYSGTRHKFVLRPGAIQYTLDAALVAPASQEGQAVADEVEAGQAGLRHDAIRLSSGTRPTYALVPGGIQYTLDALFSRIVQDEAAATSLP